MEQEPEYDANLEAKQEPINCHSDTIPIEIQFTNLLQELTQLKTHIADIHNKCKLLEKSVGKELKKKKTVPKAKSSITGFFKPVPISDKLCAFMGLPTGSEHNLADVTQYITDYIRNHKLQDMTNRKQINMDEKLRGLMGSSPLTYFNLQKYISLHFTYQSLNTSIKK